MSPPPHEEATCPADYYRKSKIETHCRSWFSNNNKSVRHPRFTLLYSLWSEWINLILLVSIILFPNTFPSNIGFGLFVGFPRQWHSRFTIVLLFALKCIFNVSQWAHFFEILWFFSSSLVLPYYAVHYYFWIQFHRSNLGFGSVAGFPSQWHTRFTTIYFKVHLQSVSQRAYFFK